MLRPIIPEKNNSSDKLILGGLGLLAAGGLTYYWWLQSSFKAKRDLTMEQAVEYYRLLRKTKFQDLNYIKKFAFEIERKSYIENRPLNTTNPVDQVKLFGEIEKSSIYKDYFVQLHDEPLNSFNFNLTYYDLQGAIGNLNMKLQTEVPRQEDWSPLQREFFELNSFYLYFMIGSDSVIKMITPHPNIDQDFALEAILRYYEETINTYIALGRTWVSGIFVSKEEQIKQLKAVHRERNMMGPLSQLAKDKIGEGWEELPEHPLAYIYSAIFNSESDKRTPVSIMRYITQMRSNEYDAQVYILNENLSPQNIQTVIDGMNLPLIMKSAFTELNLGDC